MNTKLMTILGTAGLLLAAALPVFAHHSFSAEFDVDKPVKLEGTVVKMDWVNPHSWLYIDVKGADGTVQHWQVEGGAPGVLLRNGWTKNTLARGNQDHRQRAPGQGRRLPRELQQYPVPGRPQAGYGQQLQRQG